MNDIERGISEWVDRVNERYATIAALQVDPYKQGFIDALEKVASDWASKEFRGHDEIQSVEVQAFLDTRHVHYEECRGMKPLQSQLTRLRDLVGALPVIKGPINDESILDAWESDKITFEALRKLLDYRATLEAGKEGQG